MKFFPLLLVFFMFPAFSAANEVIVPSPTVLTVQNIVESGVCPDCGQAYQARQFRPFKNLFARVRENFQARREFRLERRYNRVQRRQGRFLSRLFFWRN